MKYVAYDTNTLLKNPFDMHERDHVLISGAVLDELDNQKERDNSIAFYARRARREIEKRQKSAGLVIDLEWEMHEKLPKNWGVKNDHIILSSALRYDAVFISNDLLPLMKAEALGLEVENIIGVEDTLSYTGMLKFVPDDTEFSQEVLRSIYTEGTAKGLNLIDNQYLIIEGGGKKAFHNSIFRFKDGKLHQLDLPDASVVEAWNEEQACALDLLWNRDIPIKIITGTHGSGKTILATKVAIQEVLDDPDSPYQTLMIVRNPIGSGEKIGWLKGDKEDKTKDFFKPIEQHAGEIDIDYLERKGIIKKEIPFYMKGLSIESSFIMVDEAEDLDKKLIKLLGSRVGQNSCIVFTGDYKQAENEYVANNGLLYAIEHLKGNPLVGIVCLQEDVRSEASRVFADI